jgi:hypothetical protein
MRVVLANTSASDSPMTIGMRTKCLEYRESYSFATVLDLYKFDEHLT